ncbi:MAG: CCA tRNA nucleotidyltransferase [Smithellaceae bacterium]|nr:CCA tRNA nucleotidyltransferase [Smithellaceae bacterium]
MDQKNNLQLAAAMGIVRRLKDAGHEAYLVGGCVRDLLLGKASEDFDISTSARAGQVQALFGKTVPLGVKFGVIAVIEEGHSYEVATFRTEEGYRDGRRPESVSYATAEQDVRRRDFTINGLMMDPETGEILDYVGGRDDLGRRLIRTIGDPEVRFSEDHLRLIRAVRFAANLDFEIEDGTFQVVRRMSALISTCSAERIREELIKTLCRGSARRGLELLNVTGLLEEIIPELKALQGVEQPPLFHPEGDVWEHTLRMLALLPLDEKGQADPRLAWSVLLHDVGKATTRFEDERGIHFYGHTKESQRMAEDILERFRFSRTDQETIINLIASHMLFMNVTQMRPGRLKRFLRIPEFPLHLELHRLDCLGSHGMLDNYKFCKKKLEEFATADLHPPRLITGRDLIGMGIPPGPVYGEILRAVEEAQLNGELTDTGDAIVWVRKNWLKDQMPS